MSLKLNSSGGGSVTLQEPVTASTLTLTLPAFSGTAATLATVTNNGVLYVNSSGQPTSGSALAFDGTNLGVGTSSPANIGAGYAHLEVNGSSSGVLSISANGVRGLSLSADGSLANVQARVSGQSLTFWTNNAGTVAERMRINSIGGVGIGTSNADQGKLTIFNSSNGNPATSGSSDANIITRIASGAIALDTGIYGSGVAWIQNRIANNYASNYGLALNPNGGNVGVRTSAAANAFQVGDGTADTRGVFYSNNAFAIGIANASGFAGWIGGSGATDTMVFSSSGGTERMRIDSSGNLLVGMSSSNGYQKVSWSGTNSGDTSIPWANVSSVAINMATLFPSLNVGGGQTMSFMLQIVTSSSSSSATSARILCLRRGDSTWYFGSVESIGSGATVTASGSSNTITLTFSGGGQYGMCRVLALSN